MFGCSCTTALKRVQGRLRLGLTTNYIKCMYRGMGGKNLSVLYRLVRKGTWVGEIYENARQCHNSLISIYCSLTSGHK